FRFYPLWNSRFRKLTLRNGERSCAPVLLRTCRMIYQEMLPEFYGCIRYCMEVYWNGIIHIGGVVCGNVAFPSTFRMIRSLQLDIRLQASSKALILYGREDEMIEIDRLDQCIAFQDRIKKFANFFSRYETR